MLTRADKPCILVAEDDPGTAELLARHLQQADYRPVVAQDGVQALAMVERYRPQVILSDWLMPVMDGLQLCHAAKSLHEDGFVYFIMLTIRSEPTSIMEAFDAGVDDFLAKPFHQDELLARVRVGRRMAEMHAQLADRIRTANRLNRKLAVMNQHLQELASSDELTGLMNRRQAILRLKVQCEIAARYEQPLSCAMIDLDHFKDINDHCGHLVGDSVLCELAGLISGAVRAADSVFRFGGEEFLLLFPQQEAKQAAISAERCRALVASHRFIGCTLEDTVTISVGVAQHRPAMRGPNDLLLAADRFLYEAKRRGRNRTVVEGEDYLAPTTSAPVAEPTVQASP